MSIRSSICSELETLASCPVCLSTEGEPKLLPCQHTVCLICLMSICKTQARCPQCRAPISAPGGDPRNFPTHRAVKELSEKVAERKKQRCQFCRRKDIDAISYCTDCSMFICDGCSSEHKVRNLFRGHNIIPFQQSENVKCPSHKKVIKYFCHMCDHNLCSICIQNGLCDTHPVVLAEYHDDITQSLDLLDKEFAAKMGFDAVSSNYQSRASELEKRVKVTGHGLKEAAVDREAVFFIDGTNVGEGNVQLDFVLFSSILMLCAKYLF